MIKHTTIILSLLLSISSFGQSKKLKEYHYDNGKLMSSGYENAEEKEIGEWKSYHENGTLASIGNFEKGEPEGEWKLYYESGKLEEVGKYKNGEKSGEWKTYYESGKLKEIGKYKKGKADGEWKYYKENGELEEIEVYKDGI